MLYNVFAMSIPKDREENTTESENSRFCLISDTCGYPIYVIIKPMFIVGLNILVITVIIIIAITLTFIAIGLIIGSLVRSSIAKKKGKKTLKVGMWIGIIMLILPWIFVLFTIISFKKIEKENHAWDGSKLQDEIVAAVIDSDSDALSDMMAENEDIPESDVEAFLAAVSVDNDSEEDVKRYTSSFGADGNSYTNFDELITFGPYRPESETQNFFSFFMKDINDAGESIYIAGAQGDKESEDGVGIYYMVLADEDGEIIASVGQPQTWTYFRTPEVDKIIYDMTVEAGYEPTFDLPDPDSFFEQQELSISQSGDISFVTGTYNAEGEDLGEQEVGGSIRIFEDDFAGKDGYKVVTALISYDMNSLQEGQKLATWQSAFDRYTGTSFEFDSTQISEGEIMFGNVEFEYNGETYDISMKYWFDFDEENNTKNIEIDVICPEDYNGTVFQIGYSDLEINAANTGIDYSARLYTIDELPGFNTNGHDYYYFSASND